MTSPDEVPDVDDALPEDRFAVFLQEARASAEAGKPKSIKIRRLLRYVGAARRGTVVVGRLQRILDEHHLVSDPPFTQGWIDNYVVLRPAGSDAHRPAPGPTAPEAASEASAHVALTVASLRSATAGVCSIERTEGIELARSRMLRFGYSQLAVMSGVRRLVGAVSWESMAKAGLRPGDVTLGDATVPATPVRQSDDLIALIPRIIAEGFVFVLSEDQSLSGIVTTADLSEQFATLANPFFLIAEIERRLRLILTRHFTAEDLADAIDPEDSERDVTSPDSLTLGEVARLLENPEHWGRLEWPLERKEFIAALHAVREIRNDVMHFSPDPLSDDQLQALHNLLAWLRVMEPRT